MNESFRDSINTINPEGNREYVFPRKPHGILHKWRMAIAWLLLAFFFIMPFIRYDSEPLFLFDVISRKFILFGQIFWPQDTYIFAVMMLTLMVFVVVFTVAYGRLWCGWTCPQTIFMEMLFRKIEYLIDGDSVQQRKLKKQAWDFEKVWKRLTKYMVFAILSCLVANTLFAWVIGTDKLFEMMTEPVSANMSAFIGLLVLAGFLMFVYSWFREQVCIILCPYGRLQSVLLDNNTIMVAYDYYRGEPRGLFRKDEDRAKAGKGDCVECNACVEVCPTAIDIRNGTQLECINCTACIDACNKTMARIGKLGGLIRFDSENGISTGRKLRITWRIAAYSSVLTVLLVFLVYLIFSRTDIETTVLRTPGLLFQKQEGGKISNVYNIKVVNKKREKLTVEVRLLSPEGEIAMPSGHLSVNEAGSSEGVFLVYLDEKDVKGKIPISLGIYAGDKMIEKVNVTFVGEN